MRSRSCLACAAVQHASGFGGFGSLQECNNVVLDDFIIEMSLEKSTSICPHSLYTHDRTSLYFENLGIALIPQYMAKVMFA